MNPAEYRAFLERYGEDFAKDGDFTLAPLNEWRSWPWGTQRNFWATNAGDCPRALFLTMWDVPQSNPELADETVTNFAVGDKVEEHVLNKYRRIPGPMWEQVGGGYPIPGCEADLQHLYDTYGVKAFSLFNPRVSYKIDAVKDDRGKSFGKTAKFYAIEVKSAKEFPFTTHTKTGADEPFMYGWDAVPPEGYFLQLHSYLYGEKIQDGFLHAVNKNVGAERVWHIKRNEQLVEDYIIAPFREVFHAYVHRKIPDRPYSVKISKRDPKRILKTGSDWQCRYCNHADRCWNLGNYEDWEWDESPPEELLADAKGQKRTVRKALKRRPDKKGGSGPSRKGKTRRPPRRRKGT